MRKKALVTGGAGFIGSHLVDRLLSENWEVVAIDNFDPYYDKDIKQNNLRQAKQNSSFRFIELDICDNEKLVETLGTSRFDCFFHLAAKAGVRPSIKHPFAYQKVNVNGTQNLLELAKKIEMKKFIFASSSSVYGVNKNVPWKESDYVLQPISPYASSKVSGELLGHVYSHLNDIQFLALRFFTVYGPRQRPDLAIHKFTKMIMADQPIPVYGDGTTRRDYTFVNDVVDGLLAAVEYNETPFEIINIGNNRTVSLSEMIAVIENVLGKKALINRLPEQPGDVSQTYASIEKAKKLLGYNPQTSFEDGIRAFKDWVCASAVA